MGRAFECRRRAKEARWDKMSRVFPKLARSIAVAARSGGGDPEMNARLRTAILNAKAQNMPKDKIEAAIARATGSGAADYSEITYEARLPLGVMAMIECATDNTNRSVVNLRTILKKNDGELVPNGSLSFLFERKSVFDIRLRGGQERDEVELELIDFGLEELEDDQNDPSFFQAIGSFEDFGSLQSGIEQLGLELLKSSHQRIPTSPVELSENELEQIETILELIEEDDDVQAVYSNLA